MLYTKTPDYKHMAQKAIIEMHQQVGDLVIDENGLAVHGMLFKYLDMPGGLDETKNILRFIATTISKIPMLM